MNQTKFCILKGKEGWGDRLQCLMQALYYCEKTNRNLVIDWRDDDWCHNKQEESFEYFTIDGNSKYSLKQFLEYYEENISDLSVFPATWSNKIKDSNFDKYIHQKQFHIKGGNSIPYHIAEGNLDDFKEDVVVLTSYGLRCWKWESLSRIRLSETIQNKVSSTCSFLKVNEKQYNVVHLRAGSKYWMGGLVGNTRLKSKIDQKYPTRDSYFEFLHNKYQSFNKELPLIILSDNRALAEQWVSRYKCGIVLEQTNNLNFYKCGTHKIKSTDMKGFNKNNLNNETLRDFSIMLGAKEIANDELSLFSNMALGCIKNGVSFPV